MKVAFIAPVCAAALLVPVTARASPAGEAPWPARCVFLAKDVHKWDGTYSGDFAVLRKTGKRVVGRFGSFYSEFATFRGRVDGRTLSGTVDGEWTIDGVPLKGSRVTFTWIPDEMRIKGWRRVTRKKLGVFAGAPVKGWPCPVKGG